MQFFCSSTRRNAKLRKALKNEPYIYKAAKYVMAISLVPVLKLKTNSTGRSEIKTTVTFQSFCKIPFEGKNK